MGSAVTMGTGCSTHPDVYMEQSDNMRFGNEGSQFGFSNVKFDYYGEGCFDIPESKSLSIVYQGIHECRVCSPQKSREQIKIYRKEHPSFKGSLQLPVLHLRSHPRIRP